MTPGWKCRHIESEQSWTLGRMPPVAPTPAGLRSQHLGAPGESLGVMQLGWPIYAPAAAHDLHALIDAEARTDEVHLQESTRPRPSAVITCPPSSLLRCQVAADSDPYRNVTRVKMTNCSSPTAICVWGSASGMRWPRPREGRCAEHDRAYARPDGTTKHVRSAVARRRSGATPWRLVVAAQRDRDRIDCARYVDRGRDDGDRSTR